MAELELFSESEVDYKCPTMDTFTWPELHGHITLDTENHDPLLKQRGSGWAYDLAGRNGGKIIGISILADNLHEYLPIGHAEGNMDPVKVKAWLRSQLRKDHKQKKIFANSMYDLGWLAVEGLDFEPEQHELEDILYQAPLIDENRFAYSLDQLGKDYLGFGKDEKLLLEAGKRLGVKNTKKDNVKGHLMRIDPNIVGIYAKQDTKLTRALWDHFNPLMEEDELQRVYELEMDLVPMHIAMRLRGIRVDVAEAERQQRILLDVEKKSRAFIKDKTGIEIASWDNSEELARVFDKLQIKYEMTEKSKQPSITAGWLRSLNHEIADAILLGKRSGNNRATFIENAILNLQERGRIYPSFNQLRKDDDQANGVIGKEMKSGTKGAISGRYSSSGPNFQQIPTPEKDDPNAEIQLGLLVRSLILPEEGELWHGLDYSSQEPRGIVHFAEVTKCQGAREVAERYRNDPNTDFHLENSRLIVNALPSFAPTPEAGRKPSKTIGLGIAYGMGGGKLCFGLGLPYTWSKWKRPGEEDEVDFMKAGPEGQEIIDAFNTHAPYIKQLAMKCQGAVKKKGYIVTPLGRRFRFPKDGTGRYMFLNKALNRLIQGTSADMTKLAMRDLWRNGILPLGTVHDEIDFSASDPRVIKRAIHIMENALPFTIPIRVDVGTGENWGIASSKAGGKNAAKFLEGV